MLVQDTALLILCKETVIYQLQTDHKQIHGPCLNPLSSQEKVKLIGHIYFAFRIKMELQVNLHIHQLMSLKSDSSGIPNPNTKLSLQKYIINA